MCSENYFAAQRLQQHKVLLQDLEQTSVGLQDQLQEQVVKVGKLEDTVTAMAAAQQQSDKVRLTTDAKKEP